MRARKKLIRASKGVTDSLWRVLVTFAYIVGSGQLGSARLRGRDGSARTGSGDLCEHEHPCRQGCWRARSDSGVVA